MLSYFKGEEQPICEMNIGEYFDHICTSWGHREALVVPFENIRYSWFALREEVDKTAKGLFAMGLRRGDRLGILSTNNSRWVVTQLATAQIGVVLVNINPAYRESELEYALKQSESVAIILERKFKSSEYLKMLQNVLPNLPNLKYKILMEEPVYTVKYLKEAVEYAFKHADVVTLDSTNTVPEGFITWEDFQYGWADVDMDQYLDNGINIDCNDPINIQYSSGTTGQPKGITLSHRNILNNAIFTGDNLNLTIDDKLCVCVPFFHCFGSIVATMVAITHGSTIVLPSRYFDARETLKVCEKEKCTALHGVPSMWLAELNVLEHEVFDLSSLRTGTVAGASCPIEMMKKIVKYVPEITISYGLTETSPLITHSDVYDTFEHRCMTVGKAMPNTEIAIMDDQGRLVPIGTIGEVCARSYAVMIGYYNNPEATLKTMWPGGWLRSGDLGSMNIDGYINITGRSKDMIIRGGENLYPAEIENFLFTNLPISDVQIIGVPDEHFGEVVAAYIIKKDGFELSSDDVINFCKGRIAHFKIPKYVVFVDSYPLTPSGKVKKFELRKMAIKDLGLDDIAKIKTA